MELNDLTGIVIEIAIKMHNKVGPGCFEKVYEEILYYELERRNLIIERQVLMPIEYEGLFIKDAYKVDLLLERKLVLEIKSVEQIFAGSL